MKPKEAKEGGACGLCGMWLSNPAAFHPFAACAMFKQSKSGHSVEANLRAVVEYGMRAQQKGVTLDAAMENISHVNKFVNKF